MLLIRLCRNSWGIRRHSSQSKSATAAHLPVVREFALFCTDNRVLLDGIDIRGMDRPWQGLDHPILLEFLDNCGMVGAGSSVWEIGSVLFYKMLKKVTANEPSQIDVDVDQFTSSTCPDRHPDEHGTASTLDCGNDHFLAKSSSKQSTHSNDR